MMKLILPLLASLMLWGCAGNPAPETVATEPTEPTVAAVAILGGETELVIPGDAVAVDLTHRAQAESLAAQAEQLPALATIRFTGETPRGEDVLALREAFPNAQIAYDQVDIAGTVYPSDVTQLELNEQQAASCGTLLGALPMLKDVYLAEGVSLDTASELYSANPSLIFHYSVELFGQVLSTDMETVEYFKTEIGDAGLKELRKLLPMMHSLTYLKLDWCGTGNEAMAQLREDFAHRFDVVWRVFMGKFNCLTDTYKVWANGLTTEEAAVLQYCTEVRYMDIGHSVKLENIDFCAFMPNLEALIIADCKSLTSIEPLRNCTKLEYLEVFTTNVSDLSPLENLTSLEHLNISGMPVTDLSPLDGLCNLKRLWSNRNDHLEEQVFAFHEKYPDCEILTRAGHPVNYQWRFTSAERTSKVPRYALLKKQIGYETNDQSCYPRGYVREAITYESTGIPPA